MSDDDNEDPLDSDAVRSTESAYAEMCIAREAEEAEDRVKRDWSKATPEEIDAELERIMMLSDEQIRQELIVAGEDPDEVAYRTREILLAAIAEACPAPDGYEIDGPYMLDPQTGQGLWDATTQRRKLARSVRTRSEALAACHRDVRAIVAGHALASEEALDAIASLCGCPQWDYPGQVVRDVRHLVEEHRQAKDELAKLAQTAEQYKDVQIMTMADRRMVDHYKTLVDKNRDLERRVQELEDDRERRLADPPAPTSPPSALERCGVTWGSTMSCIKERGHDDPKRGEFCDNRHENAHGIWWTRTLK